jgi:probable rRNA maturation factor
VSVASGLEVEVIAVERADGRIGKAEVEELCRRALAAAGVDRGHVAVEFVAAERIRALNRRHRGRDAPTDVLSFPVDEAAPPAGPPELGDVVICAAETSDLEEAVVHGALHLAGMDHETDRGEMLSLQRNVLRDRGR